MLRFLIDTQLPPRLSVFLNERGYDALHTTAFPDGHLLYDIEIRRIAVQQERIIVTKDSDFYEHYLVNGIPPRLLYLTLGNISNQDLFTLFETNRATLEMVLITHKADVVVMNRTHLIVY
jgi:predicted nuclease of predicted toxin-antitoxin system